MTTPPKAPGPEQLAEEYVEREHHLASTHIQIGARSGFLAGHAAAQPSAPAEGAKANRENDGRLRCDTCDQLTTAESDYHFICHEARASISTCKAELHDLQGKNAHLRKNYQDEQMAKREWKDTALKWEAELAECRLKTDLYSDDLAQADAETTELVAKLAQAQAERDHYRHEFEHLNAKHAEYMQKHLVCKAQRDQLRELLQELVDIIDDKNSRVQIDSFTTQPAREALQALAAGKGEEESR